MPKGGNAAKKKGMRDMFLFGTGLFEIMFMAAFVLVLAAFAVTLVRGIGQWHKNNQSPRLEVEAAVVSKRMSVSHHQHTNAGSAGMHTSTSTDYYVTFQVESGDRMEFCVGGQEYGQLVEGDRGRLRFQGTRYLGFERSR